MDDKIFDFIKSFDPNALKILENLNITKILKQVEQLKLSGILEKLEDLNKLSALMKQMEDVKLSELVKQVEDIKLSNILKQVEENKFPDLLKNLEKFPNQLKGKDDLAGLIGTGKNITIEHKQDSIPDQIRKLSDLRNHGIITNDEFQAKKKQLLDRM
jgi:hypothetical protein